MHAEMTSTTRSKLPMNPSYDPIVIDLNNTNFRVIGILKRAIKEF